MDDILMISGFIGSVLGVITCEVLNAKKIWPFNERLTNLPSGNMHPIMFCGIFGGMLVYGPIVCLVSAFFAR